MSKIAGKVGMMASSRAATNDFDLPEGTVWEKVKDGSFWEWTIVPSSGEERVEWFRNKRIENELSEVKKGDMTLVYQSEAGDLYYQPWADLSDVGTLIDPETGDDMTLIGWKPGL